MNFWSGLWLAFGFVQFLSAADSYGPCQNCQAPDGCCYHNVVSHRCVLVPDKKTIKKTVYECQDVPYCLHRLPKIGECDCCPECVACPRYKKVLIKREVVVAEVCTTKCVVEEFIERVPGPCCRCGHDPATNEKGITEASGTKPIQPPMPPAETKSAELQTTRDVFPPVMVR